MELLAKIQKELKVPKGQFNSFAKYSYRNCEDILEAVKPLLGDGILTLSDEIVQLGDRYYVKATAVLWEPPVLDRKPSQSMFATAYAREALDKKGMDEAQITGAASSYARKYALCGLFCIDDGADADADDNTQAKPAAKPTPPKQVANSRDALKKRIKELADEIAIVPLLSKADYENYCLEVTGYELTEENYPAIIDVLEGIKLKNVG